MNTLTKYSWLYIVLFLNFFYLNLIETALNIVVLTDLVRLILFVVGSVFLIYERII